MDGLIVVLVLAVVGFVFGEAAERRHYRSIKKREKIHLQRPCLTTKRIPEHRPVAGAHLVAGSVVISVDYFKRLLAGFRGFIGGEVRSYSSLIDRARREAILRLKESDPHADLFVNLRLETSSINDGNPEATVCVEVVAYATAVRYVRNS